MTLLAVRHLGKSFGGVRAVRNVSFAVEAGETVALIGPNGAGKTTCFNLIGGQLRPDRGEIHLDGQAITGLSPQRIWRLGIARTFQMATVFGSLTVRENLQAVLISKHRRFLGVLRPARHRFAGEADALLARVGLADQADRPAHLLAYGDLKRVELAMALATQPRLLLMDEPTAGVSRGEREALMKLIIETARDGETGVLFTEHDMDAVFNHAGRIIVLHRGELLADADPATVRADARVREVYLGSSQPAGKTGEGRDALDPRA